MSDAVVVRRRASDYLLEYGREGRVEGAERVVRVIDGEFARRFGCSSAFKRRRT